MRILSATYMTRQMDAEAYTVGLSPVDGDKT